MIIQYQLSGSTEIVQRAANATNYYWQLGDFGPLQPSMNNDFRRSAICDGQIKDNAFLLIRVIIRIKVFQGDPCRIITAREHIVHASNQF